MCDKTHYSIAIEDFLHIKEDCHIFLVDKEHSIITCNETLKKTFGFESIAQIIGKTMHQLFSPEVASMAIKENEKVMETGKAQIFFNQVSLKNFKSLVFVTIKAPLYDAEKRIMGIFGVAHILSSHPIQNDLSEKLSRRECECLIHLLKGKTATEIAQEMNLSRRTIEAYTSSIKEKLGCESKSTLINKVFEIGLSSLLVQSEAISESFKPGEFIPKV